MKIEVRFGSVHIFHDVAYCMYFILALAHQLISFHIFQMDTRKTNFMGLFASSEPLQGRKLPSNRQVFQRFLFFHQQQKQTVRQSAKSVIAEVSSFWDLAGIPVQKEDRRIGKVIRLYEELRLLTKSKGRAGQAQARKENIFSEKMEDLFDIAHGDALNLIKNPEDRLFLEFQRKKGRPGYIGGLDVKTTNANTRRENRKEKENSRKEKLRMEMEASTSQIVFESDSSLSSTDENSEERGACGGEPRSIKQRRGRTNIISPNLAAALDRTNTTDRKATYVLTAAASSMGLNPEELNINRSSIRRIRSEHRKRVAHSLKAEGIKNCPIVLHWDGKLMEDLTGWNHIDRLAVLVSGPEFERLLAVPKLSTGTAAAQADAILTCLDQWGVKDSIQALSFDTTATNTGERSGTCLLLEQNLGRELLHLACRHHILELLAGAAFEVSIRESSTGPDIKLFRRFRDFWSNINQRNFQDCNTNTDVSNAVAPIRDDLLLFFSMQTEYLRNDYKELVELCILFLGGSLAKGNRFHAPGAMHKARWMSKIIYSIKIWLFRDQFQMKPVTLKGIQAVTVFYVTVYAKAWCTAHLTSQAPKNDFDLMKQLLLYPNETIRNATTKKFSRHFWYLSEELILLALFDERVSSDMKRKMVKAIEKDRQKISRRPSLNAEAFLRNEGLEQFVSKASMTLFNRLGLSDDWLKEDPTKWPQLENYLKAQSLVSGLEVTNDRAERGVALIEAYNRKMTTNEDQLQFLLQVVSEHKRMFPDPRKATLLADAGQSYSVQ